MSSRLLPILVIAVLSASCHAQSESSVDRKVVLHVSLAGDQREFHIGETIPLELAFSSTVKDHYQINMARYDRSGRMNYEQFNVTPAEGAVDPLPARSITMMGGLTNFRFLTPEPWKLRVNLNEWLRFTRPGEYRLLVASNRVGVRDPSNSFGTSPVVVRSNEVVLKIIAATSAWQKQTFAQALVTIEEAAPANPQEMDQYAKSRRQAFETLRFLGTPEATRELARLMRGEDPGGLDYICSLGLISAPDREVARKAMAEALSAPDQPISQNFLYTMTTVDSDPDDQREHWRQDQRKSVEDLIAALPDKRGKALLLSLSTAVNEAWNVDLPKEISDKLADPLIAVFDQLPAEEQNNLLTYRWDKIGGPRMLPILKRYAQSYRETPQTQDFPFYNSKQLSATALQRWYELDPQGARPAVIAEIIRPRPRFDARTLGFLPDKTLPEVDFALADHFVASDDYDASSNLASLIARYASDAILSQVIEKSDPFIGKWACAVQNPVLAYVLRASPELARPRIEKALAVREFTGCHRDLFQTISEIHFDPVLEQIAIQSLNDSDLQVAMAAATMLGKFGSPAAEDALWRRYVSWTEKWKGRESDLDLMFGERADGRSYELGLGQNLAQALATGKSWLSDESKLQRLAGRTQVKGVRQQLDRELQIWNTQPLTILVNCNSSPPKFQGSVVQYEFDSMDALKEKLAQFPAGMKLMVSIPPTESPLNDQCKKEVREFLGAHGIMDPGR
jgi:hypothetical protein